MIRKKLSRTLGTLRGFFIRGNKDRRIPFILAAGVFALSAFIAANAWYRNASEREIREQIVHFYVAANQRSWGMARACLSNSIDNDVYLVNLEAKMRAINVTKLEVDTIFPSLVNNKFAATAFAINVENNFDGTPGKYTEFAIRIFVKEDGEWRFAARSDIEDMGDALALIDSYSEYLKNDKNIQPAIKSLLVSAGDDGSGIGKSVAVYQK